ncbi:MAG TPA: hypothetical protein VHL58_09000 [Thermoanaerobaculia bacterium]|nr:hypothetical protein [Thermoanaerobaculia bacterium]
MALISSLGLFGFLGAAIKEFFMARKEERQAKRAFQRERALHLYDRQIATAEAAIPSLQLTNSAMLGMFRAWRGEMEGRLRPELTASAMSHAQERLSRLSEDGYRAISLLRFHFGAQVDDALSESDRDAAEVQELLSELMTVNDLGGDVVRAIQAQMVTDPEGAAASQPQIEKWAEDDQKRQTARLSRIIELIEKRQGVLQTVSERMREALAPHLD